MLDRVAKCGKKVGEASSTGSTAGAAWNAFSRDAGGPSRAMPASAGRGVAQTIPAKKMPVPRHKAVPKLAVHRRVLRLDQLEGRKLE